VKRNLRPNEKNRCHQVVSSKKEGSRHLALNYPGWGFDKRRFDLSRNNFLPLFNREGGTLCIL